MGQIVHDALDFELSSLPAVAPANALVVVGGIAYVGNGTSWVALTGGGSGSKAFTFAIS
jgi:hypothetical protein